MRIVKKEKLDVKKFMENMKDNRTSRSYTSLEPRNRPTSEEPKERHYAPKYAFPENTDYRSPPPPPSSRYAFEQQPIRYAPPPSAYVPYAPRPITEFAPSQHYTASPPYQQSMLNYSQTFNSQLAYPLQDSTYEQHYADLGYSQIRGAGSKLSASNQQHPQIERPTSLESVNRNTSASKQKPVSPEPIKKSLQISNVQNVQKKEEQDKPKDNPDPQKKKRKPREKKKKKNISLIEIKMKPNEEKPEEAAVEKEEVNTTSISRKFDQILALERKKIEDKLVQERNYKEIMGLWNKSLAQSFRKYFTPSVVEKLTDLSRELLAAKQFQSQDSSFEQQVTDFEDSMMKRLEGIHTRQ